jgi:hypothetical protein
MSYSDSDNDDDYSSDEFSEQEYMDEINAHERTGGVTNTTLTLSEKIVMNPLDKFIYNLKNIINVINRERDEILFDDETKIYLERMASNLEHVGNKNVLCYILGFYIIENKQINKSKFNKAISILELNLDDSVMNADIIRYGRLWENMLS